MTTLTASSPRIAAGLDRRSLVLGLGFAATAAAAAVATPRRREDVLGRAKLENTVPDRVGVWRMAPGGSLVLPETQTADSVYDQVLTRTYVAEGEPLVMLLIAYGAAQSGLMQVHRPETCYGSSGFKVSDDRALTLDLGGGRSVAARAFAADRPDRSEAVLYWTRISDGFPLTLTAQRLMMFRRGLQGVLPEGVLVRISTPGDDSRGSEPVLNAFARTLVAESGPLERALLIGPRQARI